jgi:hypothetical protein
MFRDSVTDFLVTALRVSEAYIGLVPRLAAAVNRSRAIQITDLCSGSGGPWAELLPSLRAEGVEVPVCLTDKFPNAGALACVAATKPGVRFEAESIDAIDVPTRLAGFYTVFTAFHHFRPADARAILAATVRNQQGIAVAEITSRTRATLAKMVLVPIAVWLMTPAIRPIRWSRLFWTYIVPIIPVAVLFDGIVSCLRTYTPDEMLAMAREVGGAEYDWEAGVEYPTGVPIPITYLIGIPRPADAPV